MSLPRTLWYTKRVKQRTAPTIEPFDSSLPIVVASTWRHLGELVSHLNSPKDLARWAKAVCKRNDVHQDVKAYITAEALRDFAGNVLEALKKKYAGQPIRTDVLCLTRGIESFKVREDGQYLEIEESAKTWWAMEYLAFFNALGKPARGSHDDWLRAVTTCRQCGGFFIQQRKDQQFDRTDCRTKFNNAAASRAKGTSRHSRFKQR